MLAVLRNTQVLYFLVAKEGPYQLDLSASITTIIVSVVINIVIKIIVIRSLMSKRDDYRWDQRLQESRLG